MTRMSLGFVLGVALASVIALGSCGDSGPSPSGPSGSSGAGGQSATTATPRPTATATATATPTPAATATATRTPTPEPTPRECCRVCTTGKACGDTCIAASNNCNTPTGCACNGLTSVFDGVHLE